MNIQITDFQATATFGTSEKGTASVTIGTETRRLSAWRNRIGEAGRSGENIQVFGVSVRNGRGMKAWQGMLTLWIGSGNISATRAGNFRNPTGNGVTVIGFYDAPANACQHSSQNL